MPDAQRARPAEVLAACRWPLTWGRPGPGDRPEDLPGRVELAQSVGLGEPEVADVYFLAGGARRRRRLARHLAAAG